jgi:hypothetical protein
LASAALLPVVVIVPATGPQGVTAHHQEVVVYKDIILNINHKSHWIKVEISTDRSD